MQERSDQIAKGVKCMKIGNKIRQMRKNAGYTQDQLAEKLGVSAQSISKWETETSMPDISLLPFIAEIFGISIDELFDLTIDQKLKRIENRLEIEEELSPETYKDYEQLLLTQLYEGKDRRKILSLLANLYYHRMEADSRRVVKYAKEAILLDPSLKDCQWLLDKAAGHAIWDWNFANHSAAIDFYKEAIANDTGSPKSALPYYYLIDNLLADNRVAEAEVYLKQFAMLPSANPIMVDVYPAYIALSRHDVDLANKIIENCVSNHPNDGGYLFEAAQYYARNCEYERAIDLYERSWASETAPRYTDTLQGIATIYKIIGDKDKVDEAYDRLLECLKVEWGYGSDDKPYLEVLREKMLVNKEK